MKIPSFGSAFWYLDLSIKRATRYAKTYAVYTFILFFLLLLLLLISKDMLTETPCLSFCRLSLFSRRGTHNATTITQRYGNRTWTALFSSAELPSAVKCLAVRVPDAR
jgi:hypothetical protein